MSSVETAFAAIALSFVGGNSSNLPLDQILINKPVPDPISESVFQFLPIDLNEIRAIEDRAVLAMGTTKCCGSGTCDIISHEEMMRLCQLPNGSACP
ncbi:MAG: hypothetical protein Q4A98_02120 [Comamonadaceae bacterium]|nr:hypothetical protein [Comamonadaceae bacterium]